MLQQAADTVRLRAQADLMRYRQHREQRRSPFFFVAKNVEARILTRHTLHINCVYTHPSKYITLMHTHRGNSSGVGVQIKTNADESSYCEPHQCSAAGAVLPQ